MILPLLQALYDPEIPLPQTPDFYEKALEDIEFFSIFPQVYSLLRKQSRFSLTPVFFQSRLEQKHKEALFQNMVIKSQMQRLLSKFDEACIPVTPLKGIGFAEKYFGDIGARGTSDIDLLIHPEDLEKAIQCVKSMGFAYEQEHIPSHFHSSFSKPLPNSKIPLAVEIHWHLLKDSTSCLSIKDFWSEAKPLGTYKYVKEMSDFHTFYLICLHGWRHNMDSMKYFIDIIQMIYEANKSIEYSYLFKQAASHGTSRRITRTLAIVYHYFPHLEKVKALPVSKKKRLWWDYNAIRDHRYKPLKVYLNLLYYEFFDFDTIKHSLTALWHFLYERIIHKRGGKGEIRLH